MGDLVSSVYYEKSQTLVTSTKRHFQDIETGEVLHLDAVTKRVYGSKQFWKVYLSDFLAVLGIFDSKQVDVFIHIVEHASASDNLFIGTYKSIAKAVGCSEPTVSTILKKLQTNNFVAKVQNGVYRVNPNVMMKGNENKRQMLLSYYEDEKQSSIDIHRGLSKPFIPSENTIEGQLDITEYIDVVDAGGNTDN